MLCFLFVIRFEIYPFLILIDLCKKTICRFISRKSENLLFCMGEFPRYFSKPKEKAEHVNS